MAVPFWSSFLADARHLPHGRHQAGTATSTSTGNGTTSLAAYQRASEPKKLVLLPGGHFDAYIKDFDAASGAACQWFLQHLGSLA
jgi:hypothetical protein